MKRWFCVCVLSVLLAPGAVGQKGGLRAPSGVTVAYAQRVAQGFSMRVWLSNQMVMGLQAWDVGSGGEIPLEPHYGLEYPVGSGIEHLYAAAPWIAGIVNGVRRVSEAYTGNSTNFILPDLAHPIRSRIWHTSILSLNEPNRRDFDDDADGKIDDDELDGVDNDGDWVLATDDVGSDGSADPFESGCKGGYDALRNPDPAYDNFDSSAVDPCHPDPNGTFRRMNDADLYTEKNGIPDHGEPHVDEDYGAVSESDYLLSATDTLHGVGHFPMGLKVIQKSYAWSSLLGEAILPMEYTVVNIGSNVIRDVYLSMFADMDVGPANSPSYFIRNYSCYFDSLRTGFVHNPIDPESTPLGITLLKTSRSLDSLKYIFHWFDFSSPTPGSSDSALYAWVSGIEFPNQLISPCQNANTPSDTRFFFSFGPFVEFKPGDTLMFSIALVSGFGVDEGPGNLRVNAERAIVMSAREYHLPTAPPSPPLKISVDHDHVRLDWSQSGSAPDPLNFFDRYDSVLQALPDTDWRRRDDPDPLKRGGRAFEGFKLWRSSSVDFDSASFVQLAQFDVADDLGYGAQTGLRFSYIDSTARRGRIYWYAVTSYSVPPSSWIFPVRPNDPAPVRAEITGLESGLRENATRLPFGFDAAAAPGKTLVVPNPYRADNKYLGGVGLPEFEGASHGDNGLIWFIHLPAKATIRVFSLVGDAIATIDHDDAARASRGQYTGQEEWRIISDSGLPLASGVYVFSVESDLGTQIGKFVVMR